MQGPPQPCGQASGSPEQWCLCAAPPLPASVSDFVSTPYSSSRRHRSLTQLLRPGWGPDDTRWVCASSCQGLSLPLSPPTKRWAHTGRGQATKHRGQIQALKPTRQALPPISSAPEGPRWPAPPTTLQFVSWVTGGPRESREDDSPPGPSASGLTSPAQPPAPRTDTSPHTTASRATTKRQRQSL